MPPRSSKKHISASSSDDDTNRNKLETRVAVLEGQVSSLTAQFAAFTAGSALATPTKAKKVKDPNAPKVMRSNLVHENELVDAAIANARNDGITDAEKLHKIGVAARNNAKEIWKTMSVDDQNGYKAKAIQMNTKAKQMNDNPTENDSNDATPPPAPRKTRAKKVVENTNDSDDATPPSAPRKTRTKKTVASANDSDDVPAKPPAKKLPMPSTSDESPPEVKVPAKRRVGSKKVAPETIAKQQLSDDESD